MRVNPKREWQKFRDSYNSLQKNLSLFVEANRLHVLYGMILITPAKEIKKMKLRQIKKEMKMLIKIKEDE